MVKNTIIYLENLELWLVYGDLMKSLTKNLNEVY
jgi:hypothetical protein